MEEKEETSNCHCADSSQDIHSPEIVFIVIVAADRRGGRIVAPLPLNQRILQQKIQRDVIRDDIITFIQINLWTLLTRSLGSNQKRWLSKLFASKV